jgi:O-antigen/teichoic acid export membrane protein
MTERAIRRGAAGRLLAEVVGRGLQFLLIYAAQRALGPSQYGHFTFAVAVGLVASSVTDLGMPLIATREIARNRDDAARLAGAALALKLAFVLVAIPVLGIVALSRAPDVRLATFTLALAVVAASFVELVGYVLRGLQRVHQETVLLLILRLSTAGFGAVALFGGYGLGGLAAAYLMSGASVLMAALGWLSWRFFTPVLSLDAFARRAVLRPALTLGGATVLSVAYTRTGVFVLDRLYGAAAVGIYGVAQKLTEPLALIPASAMAAVFPAMTGAGARTNARYRAGFWIVILAAAGTLVAAVGVAFGRDVVRLLYEDEYLAAGAVLQILALAAIPIFVNYVLTHLLVAQDRQRLNLFFNAVVFVANAGLCLWLVPRFGARGAAAAILISEILLLALCWAGAGRSLAGTGQDRGIGARE